ncbi:MAG: hypothetical protein ACJ8GW_11450 [Massilia sp.]
MDLAAHQRILLGLLRANYQVRSEDDDYFRQVAQSPDLAEARGNIYLWRVYVLERTCVLTVALLRQQGRFEAALQDFIGSHNVSPFREYQPLAFLDSLADDADDLLVSVSRFELALMQVREGNQDTHVVYWQHDPRTVLHSLAQDQPCMLDDSEGRYITRISHTLPHLFTVEEESTALA